MKLVHKSKNYAILEVSFITFYRITEDIKNVIMQTSKLRKIALFLDSKN